MPELLGIVGSGAIACGLAAVAANSSDAPVVVCARSEQSAERARARVATLCERFEPPASPAHVTFTTDRAALASATLVVEAIAEELEAKTALLTELVTLVGEDAILASTTSSLSIEELAGAGGVAERFVGLHVFNPVTKMELVELVFPARASEATRERARAFCEALGKTAIEVPDLPGFVVNSLLFPFLFGAVVLLEQTGIAPQDLDDCLRLGAGHAIGPLAVLDLVAAGKLGRKTGVGFHTY